MHVQIPQLNALTVCLLVGFRQLVFEEPLLNSHIGLYHAFIRTELMGLESCSAVPTLFYLLDWLDQINCGSSCIPYTPFSEFSHTKISSFRLVFNNLLETMLSLNFQKQNEVLGHLLFLVP